MKSTPHYTLIEYHTDHGQISAIAKTDTPDTIIYGFTDHESCISFLRRNRQRRYLQNGEVRDIPVLPGHTKYDKELDAWYKKFLKEIDEYVTWESVNALYCTNKKEIDHCIITDTTELFCARGSKGIVFTRYFHSTWGGSTTCKSTLDEASDRRKIIELIRKHKDTIVKNLKLDRSFRS